MAGPPPSIDRLLRDPRVAAAKDLPRAGVRDALREEISASRVGDPESTTIPADVDLVDRALRRARAERSSEFRPVVNATGVVLHTNLGRAPMAESAVRAVVAAASFYTNLELDLESGDRDSRHDRLAPAIHRLFGAEAVAVVNNNAAAVLLSLSALAGDGAVVVSRGEQVEIGGSFRMPDIVARSGARMVEVGTTNKSHERDYVEALRAGARVVLKVHRSNFEVRGFTAEVGIDRLALLCREHGATLIHDLGMGQLDAKDGQESIRGSLRAGADLVLFSGDKLLSGPQAGVIAGRKAAVDAVRRHPLMRVLRPDKMILAALEATLLLWEREPDGRSVPAHAMMQRDDTTLAAQAKALAGRIAEVVGGAGAEWSIDVVRTDSTSGGGTLPALLLPSFGVAMASKGKTTRLATLLRLAEHPVVGRLVDGALVLDARTLLPGDDDRIVDAVRFAIVQMEGP